MKNCEANKKQYRILCFIAAKECYTRRVSFFGKNSPCHLASKLHNKLNQLRRSETHWTEILKTRPKTKLYPKRRSETHWTWSLKRKSETQWTWISTEDLKNTTCIKNSLQLLWWCAKRHHTKLHQKVMHVQVNTPWLKMQHWCSQWSRMQCMVLGLDRTMSSNKLMYNISNNWISKNNKN